MPTCVEIAQKVLGSPLKKEGSRLLWKCTIHGPEEHPSLSIDTKQDRWICGPCGKAGGWWDLIAFLARLHRDDKKGIGAYLREKGFERNGSYVNPSLPKRAPKPHAGGAGIFTQVGAFLYSPTLRKVRLERDSFDGDTGIPIREKDFRWQHLENGEWKSGQGGNSIPLWINGDKGSGDMWLNGTWGREQLGTVLGFEGEKKSFYAAQLGFEAFSYKALTPEQCSQLADADVVLWPDKDKPGLDQAKAARQMLTEAKVARSLKTIMPPEELPIAGDIIDAVRDFAFDREKVLALIETATSNAIAAEPVGIVLATVTEKEVEWLWDQRIPLGAITVLDGDPGLGKSLLTCLLASRVTRGAPFPGSTERVTPGGVIVLSAEDSLAHVVVPRLRVALADLGRIIAIPFTGEHEGQPVFSRLPNDLPILAKAINRVGAKLVIVDVFVAYLPQNLSSHIDQDVRVALAPLSELCDRTRCAALLLRHLKKSPSSNPLQAGGGSMGIVAAARSSLLLAKQPDNPDNRILTIVKSNYGGKAPSLLFDIKAPEGIPFMDCIGTSEQTADSLLSAGNHNLDERSELKEAIEFLEGELCGGPKEATAMFVMSRKFGISDRTLRRAKSNDQGIGVKSFREGNKWYWKLP